MGYWDYKQTEEYKHYATLIDSCVESFFNHTGLKFPTILVSIDQCKGDTKFDLCRIGGFYDPVRKITKMLYENVMKQKAKGIADTWLSYATFHELAHKHQDFEPYNITSLQDPSKSMEVIYKFAMQAEYINRLDLPNSETGGKFYLDNHDNFLIEIDADTKGIWDAVDMHNKRPWLWQDWNVQYIYCYRIYNYARFLNYDVLATIDRLNAFISAYPGIVATPEGRQQYFKGQEFFFEFFDKKGRYKSVAEIMANKKIQQADELTVAAIMSSKHFISQIDMLSDTERKFVLDNLAKISGFYTQQISTYKRNIPQGDKAKALEYINRFCGKNKRKVLPLVHSSHYALVNNTLTKHEYQIKGSSLGTENRHNLSF